MLGEQPWGALGWWGGGLSADSVSEEVWPSGLDSSPQIPLDPLLSIWQLVQATEDLLHAGGALSSSLCPNPRSRWRQGHCRCLP